MIIRSTPATLLNHYTGCFFRQLSLNMIVWQALIDTCQTHWFWVAARTQSMSITRSTSLCSWWVFSCWVRARVTCQLSDSCDLNLIWLRWWCFLCSHTEIEISITHTEVDFQTWSWWARWDILLWIWSRFLTCMYSLKWARTDAEIIWIIWISWIAAFWRIWLLREILSWICISS